jgi:prolyl-tRNA synthetase
VPHRITVGDKSLKEGQVEYQHRRDAAASRVAVDEAVAYVQSRLTV